MAISIKCVSVNWPTLKTCSNPLIVSQLANWLIINKKLLKKSLLNIFSFDHIQFHISNLDFLILILFYKKIAGRDYYNVYAADVTEKNALRKMAQENYQRLRNFLENTDTRQL